MFHALWITLSSPVVAVVASIATIIALLLTVFQLVRARNDARRLDSIANSLSTRYIGKFPNFMRELESLIKRTENRLVIFCDFPAYARFSNPHGWLLYRQELERRIKAGVKVDFTCLAEAQRRTQSAAQFQLDSTVLTAWKSHPSDVARLQHLIDDHEAIAADVSQLTPEIFVELLEAADKRMLEQVFSGSVKKHTLDVIPIFFWIADGREAIFSFPSIRAGEYGFLTTDQQLIRGLLDTEELFNKGSNDAGSKPR